LLPGLVILDAFGVASLAPGQTAARDVSLKGNTNRDGHDESLVRWNGIREDAAPAVFIVSPRIINVLDVVATLGLVPALLRTFSAKRIGQRGRFRAA